MVCEKVKIRFKKEYSIMGNVVKVPGDVIEATRNESSLGGWNSMGGMKVRILTSEAEEIE